MEFPLACGVLILYILLGHLIAWFQAKTGWIVWMHESGVAILLGLAIGAVLKLGYDVVIPFQETIFFYFILPPIIFCQGYCLKKRNFFRYFHYISIFGLFGTLIQFTLLTELADVGANHFHDKILGGAESGHELALTRGECMLLAAVLSATDEVATLSLIKQKDHPKLGGVLFGEGVINDAFSIVMFRSVLEHHEAGNVTKIAGRAMELMFIAICLGIALGLVIAFILKQVPSLYVSPVRQTTIVLLGGYMCYGVSEALEVSGITTLFFCSITMAHYGWHSLSKAAQVSTHITFETISQIAEGFAFTYCGLSCFNFTGEAWSIPFLVWMLFAVVFCRFFAIYSLCFGVKMLGKLRYEAGGKKTMLWNLDFRSQTLIAFGGIIRGAIAWAQVLQIDEDTAPAQQVLVTTTLGVVFISTVVFGALTPPAISWLGFAPQHMEIVNEQPRYGETANLPNIRAEENQDINASLLSVGGQHSIAPPENQPSMSSKSDVGVSGQNKAYASGFVPASSPGELSMPENDSGIDDDLDDDEDGEFAGHGDIDGGKRFTTSETSMNGRLHRKWARFDDRYMKPYFGGALNLSKERLHNMKSKSERLVAKAKRRQRALEAMRSPAGGSGIVLQSADGSGGFGAVSNSGLTVPGSFKQRLFVGGENEMLSSFSAGGGSSGLGGAISALMGGGSGSASPPSTLTTSLLNGSSSPGGALPPAHGSGGWSASITPAPEAPPAAPAEPAPAAPALPPALPPTVVPRIPPPAPAPPPAPGLDVFGTLPARPSKDEAPVEL
jgi:NhaP-type Na+/H+ or K+/H+ antiporter